MAKEEVILEFKVEQGDAIAEAEKLKKVMIGLKQDQQELNKKFKEGEVSLEEYASESVRLEQVLKKTSKAYGDVSHKIQGTKSMTDQLKGSLQTLAPGMSSTITGFQGMAKAALAFIATPIGAILAALAVVIGVVVAAFKKSEPVLDFFENIVTKAGAAVDFFLTNLQNLGKLGFSGFIKGIGEATTRAQLYLDTLREVEDAQNLLTIEQAASEKQIKALIVASKNRNLSFDEQREKIKEALKLEEDLTNKRVELARKTEIATIKEIAATKGQAQTDSETFDQFVHRLLTENKLGEDQAKQVAELSAARIQAETATLAFREKAANQLDEISNRETAAIQKVAEERRKVAEAEAKRNEDLQTFLAEQKQKEQDDQAEEIDKLAEHLTSKKQTEADINQLFADIEAENEQERATASGNVDDLLTKKQQANLLATHKLRMDLMKQGLTEEQANAKIHQMIEATKFQQTSDALGQAASLFRENTVAYKVTATAKAIIDTYSAANAALASSGNPILGAIMAAIAVALGLANVARITGVAAAGGAKFTTRGPTMLLVGDNPGGRERVEVTPISGRGRTRVFGGGRGIALAGGGTVDGALMASAATQQMDAQFNFQNTLENMPPVFVSWTEKTQFEEKMNFKASIVEK